MSQDKIKSVTLAQRVTEKLRDDILSGQFRVGERITIKDVADKYGVSNMPVREAFRTLEGEKLLEVNAYKGATVLKVDESFVRQVYQMLAGLELVAYEAALPNLNEGLFERLRELNEEMRGCAEPAQGFLTYFDLNTKFHSLLMEESPNEIAVSLYNYYHGLIHAIRRTYYSGPERIRCATAEHADLIEALRSRDTLRIKVAVDTHCRNAMESFLKRFHE